MKTRNGFVSNSSTTSFLVAVKNNVECENINLSNLLLETMSQKDKIGSVGDYDKLFMGNMKLDYYISDLERILSDFKLAKVHAQNALNYLREQYQNKDLVRLSNIVINLVQILAKNHPLDHTFHSLKSTEEFDGNVYDLFKSIIETMEKEIVKTNKQEEKINEMLAKVKFLQGDYDIINFGVDSFDDYLIKEWLKGCEKAEVVKILCEVKD